MDKKQENRYWTKLEEFEPEVNDALQNSEKSTTRMNRRTFLELLTLSFAATSCAKFRKPVQKIVPLLNKPEYHAPGTSLWYASTCGGCPAACGTLVKVRDGRPIKLEGNPDHPLNQGGLCAIGQASLLGVYDSQRLKQPMKKGQPVDWQTIDAEIKAQLKKLVRAKKKIVLLTGTIHSPSTRAIIDEFLRTYPLAEHLSYEPVSLTAIRRAHEKTHGKALIPAYRFDRTRVIVSFDADFLGTWLSPVEFTRQYASQRARLLEERKPLLHVQLEARVSLTGSNADKRMIISPDQQKAYLLWLSKLLAQKAGQTTWLGTLANQQGLEGVQSEHLRELEKLADILWAHRGKSLVLSSASDENSQVVVNFINQLLGNYHRTILLSHASQQNQSDDLAIKHLLDEMKGGQVGALLIYGCNPAFTLPEELNFMEALKGVEVTVDFNQFDDETTELVQYLCPDHHYIETWNDAEPQVGLYSLFQPTIRPLGNTRPFQESLLRWMGRNDTYYQYLKKYWQKNIFPKQSRFLTFLKFWEKALLDGFVDLRQNRETAYVFSQKAVKSAIKKLAEIKSNSGAFSLEIHPSHAVRDGAYTNNPYLLEFPDPISKVCWTNYVSVAPRTAQQLNIKDGQYLQITWQGKTLEVPARIQPGQQAGTFSIAMGFGRKRAGTFGTGVGVNVFPFTTFKDDHFEFICQEIQVQPLNRFKKFALIQTEDLLHNRPILLETTLAEIDKADHTVQEHNYDAMVIWHGHKFEKHKWEMAIDLNKCIGCGACIVACEVENNIPVVGEEEVHRRREMHWMRIDRYYKGELENPRILYQPMLCQQCDNASCESVCPVLATIQSSEGLNMQIYNRCVGTRFCANNCPYKVRRFNWFDYPHNDLSANLILNPDVTVRSRGVMEKCTFCVQRIEAVKIKAKKERRPIRDQEIQTACQQSCPADAIVFGDANDPDSQIAKLKENSRKFKVLEELYVKPSVTYLKKVETHDV